MAVLFLSELHDGAIGEATEEGLGLFVGGEFEGSDFDFL